MRWKDRQRSENVEDRRAQGGARRVAVGGGLLGLVIVVVAMLFGVDPRPLMRIVQNAQPPAARQQQQQQPGGVPPANDEMAQFVSVVLRDTEVVWGQLFEQMGREYRQPKLVLFHDRVNSACGIQGAAVGPFYCPLDETVYIDLSFFQELRDRHNAPGDFAEAYVLAHEIGHHVQKLMGTSDKVHSLQARSGKERNNELSVRLELQADFFAGVWAHHAQRNWQILEPGDIEEALNAASAIGDDRLQKEARGVVVPESFTHGTSEQRVRWFTKGLKTGDMTQGGTFRTNQL
jgi:predicted metalloprotease